jgi:aspartyl-tRNA(Asn)/glutamyl-tRNA(Gln) amidotransferase subunit A
MEPYNYTAYELIEKIQAREVTIEEVIHRIYDRIEKTEENINSFIQLYKEDAIQKAKRLDSRLKKDEKVGCLCGLPVGIKDLISMKDKPTTCGSKILEGYKPPFNSTVVKKLIEEEDAIIIGSTNMDEFAMGSSTENSSYGPTHNPWNLDYVPGGSSGGSGSSVAARQVLASLGSDTGGSIRCPASYCGVTGLKPTYGRVSRYGLIAYANSLDQIGPITSCVYDAALILETIAGYDVQDSTSVKITVEKYTDKLKKDIKGKRVGIPDEFFGEGLDDSVRNETQKSISLLEDMGVETIKVSLPHLEYSIPTYYLIAMSEASSNLARFDGLRYGKMTEEASGDIFEIFSKTRKERFGKEVRRRILLGTYALSAGYYDMFYLRALKARTLIREDFERAFKKCDVLVSPTMPTTAFKIGELVKDPLNMYLMDILTCPVNLAGLPALSIPCGFDENSLPIGFQLIGNYFDEKTILNIGYKLEQELGIYRKKPSFP